MRSPRMPRTLGVVIAAALMDGCMSGTNLAVAMWLDIDLHVGPETIGWVLGLGNGIYFCSTIFAGHLADRLGRQRLMVIGASLGALATGGYALATGTWGLVPFIVVRAVGAALFWPALGGWLSRGVSGERLTRRMITYNLGWTGGQVIGTWVGGASYAMLGAEGAFLLMMGLLAIAALITSRLPAQLGSEGSGPPPGTEPAVRSGRRLRTLAWVASFAAYFAAGATRNLFPQFARLHLGLGELPTTAVMVAMSATTMAVLVGLGLVRREWSSGRLVPPSLLLTTVGLLGLGSGGLVAGTIGMLLVGVNVGVCFAAAFYHSVYGRDDPSRQGGINEAIVGISLMLGAVIGGLAAGWWPPSGAWHLSASLTGLAWLANVIGPRLRWPRR